MFQHFIERRFLIGYGYIFLGAHFIRFLTFTIRKVSEILLHSFPFLAGISKLYAGTPMTIPFVCITMIYFTYRTMNAFKWNSWLYFGIQWIWPWKFCSIYNSIFALVCDTHTFILCTSLFIQRLQTHSLFLSIVVCIQQTVWQIKANTFFPSNISERHLIFSALSCKTISIFQWRMKQSHDYPNAMLNNAFI